MADNVVAQLNALKTAPIADLKAQWRKLFEREPPPFNRRYIESRLAYRVQELAYGGLKPATLDRLRALGEQYAPKAKTALGKARLVDRPISGTRLIREWQGVEYTVTVLREGFEWEGRPYKSLSAIARSITGTRWNGLVFFGLKTLRAPR